MSLPYEARNSDERDCLASWQQLEIAVMHHEPEVWAEHVADEFLVVGAARRHYKADRKAVLAEQIAHKCQLSPGPAGLGAAVRLQRCHGDDCASTSHSTARPRASAAFSSSATAAG